MREIFKKGSSTLEAAACCILILFCLMAALHIYFQAHAAMLVEEACVQAGHDAVSCTSLDEAADLAGSEVTDSLNHYLDIDASSIECEVYYAVGGEQEWKKGNFITIEVTAQSVSPFSPVSGACRKSLTVMIERNGA